MLYTGIGLEDALGEIHDHMSYGSLYFFPTNWAFNIQWHESPARSISSHAGWQWENGWKKNGTLTKPGMANFSGIHLEEWSPLKLVWSDL